MNTLKTRQNEVDSIKAVRNAVRLLNNAINALPHDVEVTVEGISHQTMQTLPREIVSVSMKKVF